LITVFFLTLRISTNPAFLVGNRVDNPLQKVGSSSPVVACKNTAMPLPLLGRGMDVGRGDSEELLKLL